MSDENNAEHEVSNIMKELQPIAFLFSVCMVVAAFYTNNEVNKTDLANVLMASLFFFFNVKVFFFVLTYPERPRVWAHRRLSILSALVCDVVLNPILIIVRKR